MTPLPSPYIFLVSLTSLVITGIVAHTFKCELIKNERFYAVVTFMWGMIFLAMGIAYSYVSFDLVDAFDNGLFVTSWIKFEAVLSLLAFFSGYWLKAKLDNHFDPAT